MTDTPAPPRTASELPGYRPILTEPQLEVLHRYGAEQRVATGDVLFRDGDETYDLIVLLEGQVRIVEHYAQLDEFVIVTYGPGEFMGEIGLLTGQRAYLTAVVRAPGRVLRIPVEQVHAIMDQELELSELILRAFLVRHSRLTRLGSGLTLVGSRFDIDTRRLLEVLSRNRLSFRWLELESEHAAEALLQRLTVPLADLPIVVVPGGELLRNPSSRALLDALGLSAPPPDDGGPPEVCDLLVVGGGPAGLAAAVYGASEGLTTVLAEDTALGGQAGTSPRIENYLGFPAGLSGEELAARAALQAHKFGVRMKLGSRAVALSSRLDTHQVRFEDGELVSARSVIIATGARYNRLQLDRLAELEGVGVYYAATQMEAQACAGRPVVIVGGGNSAGQAALFLATCTDVHLVIRGQTLATSMSRYLVERIESPLYWETECSKASCCATTATTRALPCRWADCSCLSVRRRAPTGSTDSLPLTATASCSRGPTFQWLNSRALIMCHCCSRRAGPGSSASAMSAVDRSSEWRRPSVKARSRCASCSIASNRLASQRDSRLPQRRRRRSDQGVGSGCVRSIGRRN